MSTFVSIIEVIVTPIIVIVVIKQALFLWKSIKNTKNDEKFH